VPAGRVACALLSLSLVAGLYCPGEVHGEPPTTLVFPTFLHTWGIHKATSMHLFLFLGLKTRFNNPQGLAAVRLRTWDDPTSQHDDDELTVYGVNSGEHHIIYNTSMYSLGIYGQEGNGSGQFQNPRGIAADEHGNVYVADTGNHRVVHLYNSGKGLTWAGVIGSHGDGPGHFLSPCDLALDSQGHLYVADTGNDRIQVFDAHGQYLREINADLVSPRSIAVITSQERWSYYGGTYICVVDSGGYRLHKFTPQGRLLKRAKSQETGMSQARFGYLAIDYYGNTWVTDAENHCLHKFDRHLNFIVSFGHKGKGDREFISPRGVAIWRRFGQVFVAEKAGAQYYWVGVDLLRVEVSQNSRAEKVKIRFFLTERAYLTIDIWDDHGERIKTLVTAKIEPLGDRTYFWDGRDATGNLAAPGEYRVKITAEPTYSSYHYFQKVVEKRIKL
jgi:hypothetical protein